MEKILTEMIIKSLRGMRSLLNAYKAIIYSLSKACTLKKIYLMDRLTKKL
jgi:hypothetical protein